TAPCAGSKATAARTSGAWSAGGCWTCAAGASISCSPSRLQPARAPDDVRLLPHRRAEGQAAAPGPAFRQGVAVLLRLLGALHRRPARGGLRLARRRDVTRLGSGARPPQAQVG